MNHPKARDYAQLNSLLRHLPAFGYGPVVWVKPSIDRAEPMNQKERESSLHASGPKRDRQTVGAGLDAAPSLPGLIHRASLGHV